MVLDAEVRIGPNFANLDIRSYAGSEDYEVCATWIVLQGMRSVWEKKARDASYYENTQRTPKNTMEYLMAGDPNRFNGDSERKFYGYDDTIKMTAWAQKMSGAFGDDADLLARLTPEMRFVDQGMLISGGTELRKKAYEFAEEVRSEEDRSDELATFALGTKARGRAPTYRARFCFRTRRASSVTTATILVPHLA